MGDNGARLFAGRYRATRLLKTGLGVDTLLGTDLLDGAAVIIKTAAASLFSTAARTRLEQDGKVLCQLRAPELAPVRQVGHEEDQVYVVTSFILGVTLQVRLTRTPLSIRETLDLSRTLLIALKMVHAQGLLHRDVKPANVMIDEGVPLRRATLLDCGLSRSGRLNASERGQFVGTARYVSPEQAGLLDLEVDERSDLYSTGIVFYECLTGSPPFQGETVGEVLRQHLTARQRSPGGTLPRALDELIRRLLRKDPRDRYQSAEAVLVDLNAIADDLDRGVAEPEIVIGLHDRRRTLAEPAFVGRGTELSALEAQLERTRQGSGGLVVVEAESGGGKSRLLDELAQRAASLGVCVLRGQGLDRSAQRPYQVLAGLARDLIAAAQAAPGFAEAIRQRLGDQRAAIVAALPELAETLGQGASDLLGPETFGETRSLTALSALFDALGTAERPTLVALDDCQWADELTVKLLARQPSGQDHRNQSGRHLLVMVAFRSEEVPAGHRLRTLQPTAHLRLDPFSGTDVRRLAESMAGPLSVEVLEVIERLSEGSPFMASAVLRGLVEAGALVPEASGWSVDASALSDARSSLHAAAFLARRMELLPPGAIRLLSVGAILGREFDLQLAATLAEQTAQEAAASFKEAQRRCIVWARSNGTRGVFFHDKLRETLLARMTEVERKQLHQQTALLLETTNRERVFELAYHFDASGEHTRALPYALAAADRARARHALAIAEEQYRIAERGSSAAADDCRQRIAEGLGDVLMLRGRYTEAERQFEHALSFSRNHFAQAQIARKLGELAFKRGDVGKASTELMRGLGLLGRRVPKWSATFLLWCLWELLVQALHTLLPRWCLARRPRAGADADFLAMGLYSRLAYAFWFERGKIPCAWAHLREMNLAERYPPSPELAQAYSEHAPVMTMVPWFDRGIRYAERSLAIRKAHGDPWGEGQSLHFYGIVLYASARFSECIEKCRAAVKLMERTGDRWEVNTANWHIAYCLYRLGDLKGALELARRVYQQGMEIDDHQAAGIALAVWSKCSGGRVPAAFVQAALGRHLEDVHTAAEVTVAEGLRLLGAGQPGDAAVVLEDADRMVRQKGLQQEYVAPVVPWLATALRRQIEQLEVWEPARRATLLRRARAVARRARRTARLYPNNLPHALRESALLEAMAGRPLRARKHFDASLSCAQRQGALFEHAQTLLARGRVGRTLGWPGAANDVDMARQALCALGADYALDDAVASSPAGEPVTLSLADRFDTVLDAGRRIASALSREAVYAAVRDAAVKLLRCEECLVLEMADRAEAASPVAGAMSGEYSRTMVRRALAEAGAVTFAEGTTEDVGQSILLSGVRSALCAPFFVRGRPGGCFYVTHRRVSGLFGEDEQRLAEFIATLAGSALENAAGFAELRSLNETLEERVAERGAVVEARSKELARSNAELEQFASIASHDLQEPLRKIQSFGGLLMAQSREGLFPEGQDYLQRMTNAAKRMQQLINDLLAFARVTSKARPFVPVDLARVAREVVGDLEVRIRESGGRVDIGALPEVVADPTQMRQLLQNLLGNALKYCRPGQAPLVEVDASMPTDELCKIKVRDNGIGFDEKYLDRIFGPFQRLHSREQFEGTGMGLAICQKIVERHGGTITATSVPGQGSSFIVTLPLCQPKGTPCDE